MKHSELSGVALHGTGSPLDGEALVQAAIEVCNTLPGRLRDDDGAPGGLIDFPHGLRPIIIGDLHANREHLQLILDYGTNRADIESGTAACIILGDALHDDRTGHMKDMESSVGMLDDLFRLIIQYPGKIYYIRGNHDSFDARLRKSGISPGLEFQKALLSACGQAYVTLVDNFFEALPYFIIGEGWVITHAGPPRGGIVREELINIKRYPEKLYQLLWNRVNEFHGNPSLKEYGETEIRLTLELLDLPPETQFIVGHNPIWSDGNRIGVWENVIGIQNHHIIQSGYGSRAPFITFEQGTMKVVTAAVDKPEEYVYDRT
jgi:hypothetical protein